MTIVSKQFKYHFSVLRSRLSSEYMTIDLQGQSSKSVSGRFHQTYHTLGVSGDFTRVFASARDSKAIKAMKDYHRRQFHPEQMTPVIAEKTSVSFKFIFGDSNGEAQILVSSRKSGMEYPFTHSSPKLSPAQLKKGLKLAIASMLEDDELLLFLSDIFVTHPKKHIDHDLPNLAQQAEGANTHFIEIERTSLAKFDFAKPTQLPSETIEEFSTKVQNALKKTPEHIEVDRLKALLSKATSELRVKRSKIESSLQKQYPIINDIVDFNKVGETKFFEALESLYIGYSKLEQQHRDLVGKNLYNATSALIGRYMQYRELLPSKYKFDHLAIEYSIPRNLVPILI